MQGSAKDRPKAVKSMNQRSGVTVNIQLQFSTVPEIPSRDLCDRFFFNLMS